MLTYHFGKLTGVDSILFNKLRSRISSKSDVFGKSVVDEGEKSHGREVLGTSNKLKASGVPKTGCVTKSG